MICPIYDEVGPLYDDQSDRADNAERENEAELIGILGQNSQANLIVLGFAITGFIFCKLALKVLKCPSFKNSPRASRYQQSIYDTFYYSYFLRLFVESYFDIMLSNFLRLSQTFIFDTWFESMTSCIALAFIICTGLLPFSAGWFLLSRLDELNSDEFQQKWGSLASDLRDGSKMAAVFMPVFMLRRLFFSAIIVFWNGRQAFQIHGILVLCLLWLCFLVHVRPFASPTINNLEIFNELLILINTFCLINFSDFVVEPNKDPGQDTWVFAEETNTLMGWYNVAGLGLIIVFNLSMMVCASVRDWKLRLKKIKAQKDYAAKLYAEENSPEKLMLRFEISNVGRALEMEKDPRTVAKLKRFQAALIFDLESQSKKKATSNLVEA